MDSVVVTLKAEGFEKDVELPCRVRLGELYPRLTAALQHASGMKFGALTGVVLEKEGAGMLDLRATLLDYGVCTGSILEIVEREKYNGFSASVRR